MRSIVLLAWVSVATACAPDAGGVGSTSAPIVGGMATTGEPAVVVVKVFVGFGLCTGTLITPTVVLTAKHCVQAPGAPRPYPPSGIVVGFGSTGDTTVDYPVRAVRTTPGVYTSSPESGLGGALVGVDVATITLREPITDVTPIDFSRERPTPGDVFTAVGFGQRPDGESGEKYTTTARVERITGDVLNTSMTICPGDSGGPAILEGSPRRVVGVASFGVRDQCPSTSDGYNLIEPFLGLIEASILGAGECPYDSPEDRVEACNSVDDDCDGTIDEGCLALGEACAEDTECAFAALPPHLEAPLDFVFCGPTAAGRVCTRRCDPGSPATSCAEVPHAFDGGATATEGVYCAQTLGCDGLCTPGLRGAGAAGEPCTEDRDCAGLRCDDPGDGMLRCLSPCVGDAGLCPVTEACAALPDDCGSCVDTSLLGGPRGLGEGCAGPGDCRSGVCAEAEAGVPPYCSADCAQDVECGPGFHCREARCAHGARSRTAEPCTHDGDCSFGERCAAGFCAHQCTRDESCPADFSCDGEVCVVDAEAGVVLAGERCTAEDRCLDGACVEVGDGTRCAVPCGAEVPEGAAEGAGPCPPRFECRRVDEALLCVLPEVSAGAGRRLGGGGGCSVASSAGARLAHRPASAWSALFTWVAFGWIGARRRRRPPRPAR